MLSPGGLVGRSVSSFRGGGLSSLVGGFGGVVENHLYRELVMAVFGWCLGSIARTKSRVESD